MFEIKDEDGNEIDFKSLSEEQQDEIIKVVVDYVCETKDVRTPYFTKDNFDKLIEKIKSYK